MQGAPPGQGRGLAGGLAHQDRSARSQYRDCRQCQQIFQKYHAIHIHSHLVEYGGENGFARLNGH